MTIRSGECGERWGKTERVERKKKERPGIFFLTTVESGGEVEAPWLEGEKEENIN